MKPSKTIPLGKFRSAMADCVRDIQANNTVYVVARAPGGNQPGEPVAQFIAMSIATYDALCETMAAVDELLQERK